MNNFVTQGVAALCLFASCWGDAAIYRWVDEQGRAHYGQHAPSDAAEQVDIRETDPPPAQPLDIQQMEQDRGERRRKLLETFQEEREQERRDAEKRAQEEQKRQENCVAARKRLVKYERSSAIYETLDDGSRRYLSQVERDQELELMRQAVQNWCDE